MNKKDQSGLLGSVSRVGFWTFASRIFGLVRDSVVARIFGVGFATDAFMVAFTIPNLLRRLLAEGVLSVAFVPLFAEYSSHRSRQEFQNAFQVIFTVFSLLLIGVSFLGIILSPWIVHIFAPGFSIEKLDLTTFLTRWMFPFIFFMGSSSVVVGVLNTLKSFSIPAAAPILLNFFMIACALFLSRFFKTPILALAVGVILGGFSQWVLHIWQSYRLGFKIRFKCDWSHPAIRRIFLLMGPTIFGVAVYHLNVLISRALASLLPQGSVTYLYYSDRFLEFPLGIFAISIATVTLPQLAQQAAYRHFDHLKETLFFSLRLAAFICIPAMLGLMVLRVPILSLVFQHGQFSYQNTLELSRVFLMATLGLCAVAGLRITVQAFYSLKDIKTPVKTAFASFLLNAALGFVLMRQMGAAGLTLASSIAAWFQWILLFYFLNRRVGKLPFIQFTRETFFVLLSAGGMALVLWPLGHLNLWASDLSTILRMFYVLGIIILGLGIYLGIAYLLGVTELKLIIQKIVEKLKRARPEEIDTTTSI
jgi:putative peptidoglycan lipid II flippase